MLIWDITPDIFSLGNISLKWYGLMFATSFLVGRNIIEYIYYREGKSVATLDTATIYMALGTFLGARLGSVFFYNFEYFYYHPLEIFLPFTFSPTFKFTGFQGLASHGAFIGIVTAIYAYIHYNIYVQVWPPKIVIQSKQKEVRSYWWLTDRLVIAIALAGCFIRIGNMANSELYGKPTHSNHGILFAHNVTEELQEQFGAISSAAITHGDLSTKTTGKYQPIKLEIVFKNGSFEEQSIREFLTDHIKKSLVHAPFINEHIAESPEEPLSYTLTKNKHNAYVASINTLGIPRYPAQLYESISLFVLFLILAYRWHSTNGNFPDGQLTGIFLTVVFSLRIFYEYLKPGKVVFENELITILMPQILSIPLIILGLVLLFYRRRTTK